MLYAGYLFLTRRAGEGQDHRYRPVLLSTLSAGAVSVVIGIPWHGVDVAPGWAAFGWLAALAVTGQVCGWMLIGAALRRLPAETGGTLLLLQPILAVAFGAVLLGERPSPSQAAGCALVIAAVWLTGRTARRPRTVPSRRRPSRARRHPRRATPFPSAPVRRSPSNPEQRGRPPAEPHW
ncbi:DMT family transporter [Actinomadura yumaensis]|uniref:DMT family transporter n=1 Tax=Actinomadura yumaensis TaxID=111807 RepID=UPI00361C5BF8